MTHIKNNILFIIFTVMPFIGSAQTPKESYTLSSQETEVEKKYVARDSITFTPGFSYKASTSNHIFSAKIDAGLLFPPTENTYADANGNIVTDPTQGAVVGSIPGQFAVSPTGAATYTIPIEVPAGINGMQPNISLVYNSQGGNGIVGWGWNIGGFSAITRTKKNKYFDNEDAGVTWTNECPLSLDGQRLIKISETSTIVEYRTENESFSKIIGYELQAWGPRYFEVTTKEGLVLTYGNPNDLASYSPVFVNAATDALNSTNYERFGWNLVEMKDANGNYVQFDYDSYVNSNIGNVIRQISYGANKNKTSLTNNIVISFNYEKRVDDIQGYLTGEEILQQLRLTDIQTSVNGSTQKIYSLSYIGNIIQSRLNSVTLSQNGHQLYDPLVFTYGQPNVAESNTDITFITKDANNTIKKKLGLAAIDLDGDGYKELGDIYSETDPNFSDIIRCYFDIHKKNDSWVATTRFPLSTSYANIQKGLNGSFGDFNGNGSAESVYSFFTGSALTLSLRDRKDDRLLFEEVIGYSENEPFIAVSNLYGSPISDALVILNDPVSENGMYKYPYCIVVGSSSTNPFRLPYIPDGLAPDNYYLYTTKKIKSISIENLYGHNLRDDIWINYEDGTNAILKNNFNGNSCFTGNSQSLVSLPFSVGERDIYRIVDLNSDGMPDVVYRKNTNDWYIAYNLGNSSFKTISLNINCLKYDKTKTASNINGNDLDNISFTDLNCDGLVDIVVGDESLSEKDNYGGKPTHYINTDYTFLNTTWRVYLNTSTGFSLERTFTNTERSAYSCLADLSGNGTVNWVHATDDAKVQITDFGYKMNINTMTKVSNLLLGDQNITYKPLAACTEYDNQPDENGTVLAAKDYIGSGFQPFKTTALLVTSKYENGLNKATYHYGGALINWLLRGFVGFKYTGMYNETSGQSTMTYNKLFSTNYLMLPVRTISSYGFTQSNNAVTPTYPISQDDVEYQISSLGNKRFKVQRVGHSSLDYLHDKTRTESLEYDEYNNLTLSTKNLGDDIVEEQKLVYIQAGSWCKNKVKTLTINRSITNSDSQREEHIREKGYTYDTRGNLKTETIDPEDENSIKTEYINIDELGHADEVVVTANDVNRKTKMSYYPSGRFLWSRTSPLGNVVEFHMDETKGLLLSETGVFGTTDYSYNNLNQLIETRTPDGIRTASVLQWASPDNIIGAKYYKYTQTSGKAPEYVWYDSYGREIVKQTYGLNKLISVTTEYNDKGLIKRVSEPYFEEDSGSKKWAASYLYDDDYNRVSSIITPQGTTTYTYDTYKTTVISPEETTITVFNGAGQNTEVCKNGHYVLYDYYASGKLKSSTPWGNTEGGGSDPIIMEYDLQGNRTKIVDPDAGTITSKYNGFGELVWEEQNIHNSTEITKTTNIYDPNYMGLLTTVERKTTNSTEVLKTETTQYMYDPNNHYRLTQVEIVGKNKQVFTYGDFDRVTDVVETVGTKSFATHTDYDALGRERKHVYPTGYYVTNTYDTYGNLTEVIDRSNRSILKVVAENALGQLTQISKGGKTTTFVYQDDHLPQSIVAPGVIDQYYSFNTKGNLDYREDKVTNQQGVVITQREDFVYDDLNRLTDWTVSRNGQTWTRSISFDDKGNIHTMTNPDDLSQTLTFAYGEVNNRPHALTSVSPKPASFPSVDLNVTYTDFKKIQSLTEGTKYYELTYGVDEQRRKSEYYANGKSQGAPTLTRYYIGDYEEEISGSNVRKIHYLHGAILIQDNSGEKLYYTYADYQGSLLALTDANGIVVEQYAYDPWGQRRDPLHWELKDSRTAWIINRGYTGHEYLDIFGIINMNGRVYDPATAVFFSPDPLIYNSNDWLSYNRYGYCLNNPFKYTDPSGNNPFVIVGLVLLGGYLGGVATNHGELNPGDWDWQNPNTYVGIGFGMFAGYVGGYWLYNPGALSIALGVSVNGQYGSLAIGVSGLTTTGISSDFNFHWSTSAGGSGYIPLKEQKTEKITVNKPNGDSRFFQGSYYEASQLLSYMSKKDQVERVMYETELGYYFEAANGYVFGDLSKYSGNVQYSYWGNRDNGTPIYFGQSTINGSFASSITYKNQNLFLNLNMGEKYSVSGFYHTHPGNTMLSLDDPFQDIKGIRVKAVGWDGYSRGSYFENNTYYLNDATVIGIKKN